MQSQGAIVSDDVSGHDPLATISAEGWSAHAQPRLNALDPFTAHELATLRREVEKSLAAK